MADTFSWNAPIAHRSTMDRVPSDAFLSIYIADARDLFAYYLLSLSDPEPFSLRIVFCASPAGSRRNAADPRDEPDTGVLLSVHGAPYDMIELLAAQDGYPARPDINSASLVKIARFVNELLETGTPPHKIELGTGTNGEGDVIERIGDDLCFAEMEGCISVPVMRLLAGRSAHAILPWSQHPAIEFFRLPRF